MQKRMVGWFLVVIVALVAVPAAATGWQEIDAEGVKQMMEQGDPLVVFPLSRIEYNNLHIEGSVNIPIAQLESRLPMDKSRKLVFYCLGTKCTASPKAADRAVELGYLDVYAFIGGLPAWIKKGYATTTIERLPLTSIHTIKPKALRQKLKQEPETVLIDIRQTHDVAKGYIDHPRTMVIPLDDLIERLHEIPREANVVVCCQKGKRGPTAVRYLSGKGFARVTCLKGGIKGWMEAGLPVVN